MRGQEFAPILAKSPRFNSRCALAAAKLGIPVGHVETGLRSYDLRMPEFNRRLTDWMDNLYRQRSDPFGPNLRGYFEIGKLTLPQILMVGSPRYYARRNSKATQLNYSIM